MKNFLSIVFALFILTTNISECTALTFEEAFAQSSTKPMVTLVYAPWADNYESAIQNFKGLEGELSSVFNFVELDITTKDAKFFNSKYHIYPNLPYVLMHRDGGKVSRYIPRDCLLDYSCSLSKLKSFVQW